MHLGNNNKYNSAKDIAKSAIYNMPTQQRNTEQKLRAHQLHVQGYKKNEILWKLKDKYPKPISSRTLSYWIHEFKNLESKPENLEALFELHRMEEYGLPWEACGYISNIWFEVVEAPKVVTPTSISSNEHGTKWKPTVRDVQWWWRVHNMAEELSNSDVYMFARQYASRELISVMTDVPAKYADLDAFLTYKPWLDLVRANAYRGAIKKGAIQKVNEDFEEHYVDEIIRQITFYPVWEWKQPSVTEGSTLFTPSQIWYWHYFGSIGKFVLGGTEESETEPSREIEISIHTGDDEMFELFTPEQLNRHPNIDNINRAYPNWRT